MNAQSINFSSWERRMVYFPPQQKPAEPRRRDEVEGSERISWWNLKILGRTADSRLVIKKGTAAAITLTSQTGL